MAVVAPGVHTDQQSMRTVASTQATCLWSQHPWQDNHMDPGFGDQFWARETEPSGGGAHL